MNKRRHHWAFFMFLCKPNKQCKSVQYTISNILDIIPGFSTATFCYRFVPCALVKKRSGLAFSFSTKGYLITETPFYLAIMDFNKVKLCLASLYYGLSSDIWREIQICDALWYLLSCEGTHVLCVNIGFPSSRLLSSLAAK